MIKRHFDPQKPHRAVIYLRMSSDLQNEKSPDQQEHEILKVLTQKEYPWTIVDTIRDDAISGRYNRNPPGFKDMIHRIRKSELKIDLILVDTLERFGRNKELPRIIDELRRQYGVILLTADMRFEDPTTSSGQLFQLIETHRATRDNEVKAHQVLRGKRDKIARGFWPGGPPPYGTKLESVMSKSKSGKLVIDSKLVRNLVTAPVITSVLIQAAKTGAGGEKLANWFNSNDELLAIYGKPILESTISKWLQNALYIGTYVWNKYAIDIENDRRIVEKKDDNEIEVFENFCEPLIDPETWNKVQYYRIERAKKHKSGQVCDSSGNEKIIQPRAKGVALKYPLTGLVRCGCCGSSMNPSSSTHISKRSGEEKRYARYTCVPSHSGACLNKTSVPEQWLRTLVLDHIRTCLFPGLGTSTTPKSATELLEHEVFQNLVKLVQRECEQNESRQVDLIPQRRKEIEELEKLQDGWIMTLGDKNLSQETRRRVQDKVDETLVRINQLKLKNDADESFRRKLVSVVDPQRMIDILQHLDETITSENASLMNIELAQHIESIACYPDGRVVLRTCKLGALSGDDSLFATENAHAIPTHGNNGFKVKVVSRPPARHARVDRGSGTPQRAQPQRHRE